MEKTLAVLVQQRDRAIKEANFVTVPVLDIQILKLEKQILSNEYKQLATDALNVKFALDAQEAKNKQLVARLNESDGGGDFRAEREAWKRRIEEDAQTIKQLKAINMRLRETKFGGNKDVLELERERQLLLLKIQELNEKGPEKLQELKEKNKSLKLYIGQLKSEHQHEIEELERKIEELEETNLKHERPKRTEEELRKLIEKNAIKLAALEDRRNELSEKEYNSQKRGLNQSTNRAQKDLQIWAEFKKRRIETCIMCSNVATVASQVYYCSSNCMNEHHSK